MYVPTVLTVVADGDVLLLLYVIRKEAHLSFSIKGATSFPQASNVSAAPGLF